MPVLCPICSCVSPNSRLNRANAFACSRQFRSWRCRFSTTVISAACWSETLRTIAGIVGFPASFDALQRLTVEVLPRLVRVLVNLLERHLHHPAAARRRSRLHIRQHRGPCPVRCNCAHRSHSCAAGYARPARQQRFQPPSQGSSLIRRRARNHHILCCYRHRLSDFVIMSSRTLPSLSRRCHPERSTKFAKRTSCGVEGRHLRRHNNEPKREFSLMPGTILTIINLIHRWISI